MQRGFRTVFSNGVSIVDDVVYPASERSKAVEAAAKAASEEATAAAVDSNADTESRGKQAFSTVAERFTANQRREHGKINSYNALIQFCIRSNMDIKGLLRDSDARGALFYILNYSTKSETTMDALLNVLAPVVERIKDENDDTPAAVVAAQMIRSCSAKTVAHQRLGATAAASKVLGYDDAKISHEGVMCPLGPLLAETSASFVDLPAPQNATGVGEDDGGGGNGDGEGESRDDGGDDHDDSDDEPTGVMLSTFAGKITISPRMHHLYVHRCAPDDVSHPYFNMPTSTCLTLYGRALCGSKRRRQRVPSQRLMMTLRETRGASRKLTQISSKKTRLRLLLVKENVQTNAVVPHVNAIRSWGCPSLPSSR